MAQSHMPLENCFFIIARKRRFHLFVVTYLILAMFCQSALATSFCSLSKPGPRLKPEFDVEPSLVVRIEKSRYGGTCNSGFEGIMREKFAFRSVAEAILKSAGSLNPSGDTPSFIDTLVSHLKAQTSLVLNKSSGISLNLHDRPLADTLSSESLLGSGPCDVHALQPIALFNRFDLAPIDWAHCGEYRIVYSADLGNSQLLSLILEPALGNPGNGKAGCAPIAKFWAGLSNLIVGDDVAALIEKFYFQGGIGGLPQHEPVLSYGNLGGDGLRGQIRASIFDGDRWQMREWVLRKREDDTEDEPLVSFSISTVKGTPIAELYQDQFTLPGTPNSQSFLDQVQAKFLQAWSNQIASQLTPELSTAYEQNVERLKHFDLGSGSNAVGEHAVLLNSIAIANDDFFNDVESNPNDLNLTGVTVGNFIKALEANYSSQTSNWHPDFINRASVASCVGCHQTRSALPVTQSADDTTVLLTWPESTDHFYHVTLNGTFSPGLSQVALPFRRFILASFLCEGMLPADLNIVASIHQRGFRVVRPILEKAVTELRGIKDLRDFRAEDLVKLLNPAEKELVEAHIEELRNNELQLPGAFVEHRRVH